MNRVLSRPRAPAGRVGPAIAAMTITVAALAVIVLAASSHRTKDIYSGKYHPPALSRPQPVPSQPPANLSNPSKPQTVGFDVARYIGWALLAVIAAALLYAIYRTVRYLLVLLARRRARESRERSGDNDVTFAPDDVAAAMGEAVDRVLREIQTGVPRDAIVACWVRLEEAAAGCGVVRDPAETPAELATRVLGTRDVDRQALSRLADLYREARFSLHPMTNADRAAARDALQQLASDLRASVAPIDIETADVGPAGEPT